MNANIPQIRSTSVPKLPPKPQLDSATKDRLKISIRNLLQRHNAALVAHYYTDADLQALAEETGGCVADSLDMARFGRTNSATTLVVCGVRFMGETAKILNPEKRILMPDLNATCSLDEQCPVDEFVQFCSQHSDRTVIVYANTSAAVKAHADWVVTSAIALPIVNYLSSLGKKILWAPDRYLGSYIANQTKADMLLWQGACVVHEEFKGTALERLRRLHPDAAVLVHPESPEQVIFQADVVGSTTALIKAATNLPNSTFIVATEEGIFWKMRQLAPHKQFIPAPTAGISGTCESCGHCPWMAMNTLENLEKVLLNGYPEIYIEPSIGQQALLPIERMLHFHATN
jgi:quinolinate synthase